MAYPIGRMFRRYLSVMLIIWTLLVLMLMTWLHKEGNRLYASYSTTGLNITPTSICSSASHKFCNFSPAFMASTSSPPQEISVASPKIYDAFISHRGPDVKDTLAKQLYGLLQARQCRAFLDREEIEGGDSITSAIRNGISSSVVQIAIFSKGYAQSSWCLEELILMLQQTDALFIPVFYDVQPWELRHIQNEKSQYAAAFANYQSKGRNLDRLDEWKKALASAADISGYERSQHQQDLCEKIVSRVLREIEKRRRLHVAKYPIGLDELVQDFENSCSQKAGRVGIFGLGGSGKTTLAKELFNRKRSGYDASCFLSHVRESDVNRDLHSLQSKLFKDLFHEDREFGDTAEGIGQLKDYLERAKHLRFLIILDDIDHEDQIDALLPEGMLGSGSLVIITTRDQSVLRDADTRYKMKGMEWDHAKELFCSHAFRRQDPPIAYEKLIESFVEFCGGLPLSLIVLGAHVYRRDKHYWELELEKVKKIQPKDIMQRLKISFDGLDREEKQIFIDIACFFNEKVREGFDFAVANDLSKSDKAIAIWSASGWSAEHAVKALQDKCLVEVTASGKFTMHDHLRDLGRQMADVLGPPRLWKPDILRSLEAKGFNQILAEARGRCFHSFEDSSLRMKITYFIADTDLLWLEIRPGYLLKHKSSRIPSWIPLWKLQFLTVWEVEELWSTFQQQLQTNTQASFELRKLWIWNSPSLQKLPDSMEMFSHLEELKMYDSIEKSDITSLVQSLEKKDTTSLMQSLKQLSNLRSLTLTSGSLLADFELCKGRDSSNLVSSTSSLMDRLENIDIGGLGNISKLVISGEIFPRLVSLEVDGMDNLKEMDLKQLGRLNTLTVERCEKLETITGLSSLAALQKLKVDDCAELKSLPTLAYLRRLEKIMIVQCGQLQSVEGIEKLPGLKSLIIEIPDDGYASLRDYIRGLRTLQSKKIVLIQKPVNNASSKLNANLFSGVISTQSVSPIERVRYMQELNSSTSAITIYVFLASSWSYGDRLELEDRIFHQNNTIPITIKRDWLITALLTQQNGEYWLLMHMNQVYNFTLNKGYKVTLKVGEEGKALTILQRIVDRLYRYAK